MDSNKDQFVPRLTAARLLGVSSRTLARAVNKKRIKAYRKSGRIYFSLSEIQELAHRYFDSPLSTLSSPVSTPEIRLPQVTDVTVRRKSEEGEEGDVRKKEGTIDLAAQIQKDFRDLLERQERFQQETVGKLQNKLDDAQKRLEAANYRVGQLEAELRNSVPLLESTQKTEQIAELKTKVGDLGRELRDERFSKIMYWVLSMLMLVMTLWTLFFW